MAKRQFSSKTQAITPARIAQIENGRGAPVSEKEIHLLARALEVDPEWLRTGRGEPTRPPRSGGRHG